MGFIMAILRALLLALVALLTACGGGGGGGGPSYVNNTSSNQVPYYTPTKVATIDPLVTGAYHYAIVGSYAQDLNNDGSQEVIIAGRESSAGTATQGSNWINNRMYVFGWNGSSLVDRTSQWFSGNDNIIVGTEPSIKFGNFNGNGKPSMFVAPSTDGNVDTTGAQIFVNNGSNFTRYDINFGYAINSHDSAIFRYNGVDNIVTLDEANGNTTFIFGSNTNTFRSYSVNNVQMNGKSIAAGNYLGDGSTTFVVTDTGYPVYSTRLFSWNYTGSSVSVTDLGGLPMPIFEQSQYNSMFAGITGNRSHNIRAFTFNFDNNGGTTGANGADDVVIISRPGQTAAGNWPIGSAIQFLQNNGRGTFADVTSTYVVGYDMSKPASYNPVIMDVNNDGLVDLVLPAQGNTSSQVLLQTKEGKFVGSYNNILTDFANQVQTMQGVTADSANGGTVTFVKGPNGNLYLLEVLDVNNTSTNTAQKAIYLSLVGSTNTLNAQATVNAIKQTWPYLSPAQVNQVLAATGTQYFGATIINNETIFSPYGGFGFLTNGTIRPIVGYINGLKTSTEFNSIKAVDGLGRDFTVNMSGMSLNKPVYWGFNNEIVDQMQINSHAEALINNGVYNVGMLRVAADPKNYTIGIPRVELNKNTTVGVQYTSLAFNPFVQFAGVYGTVNQSSTVETVVTRYHSDNYASQLGLMYTNTNISRGLVTSVSPIVSAWAETGYRNQGFGLFVGIKPVPLNGSVDVYLPTSVDSNGNIGYTKHNIGIERQVISYARAVYTEKLTPNLMYRMSGLITDNGVYRAQLELRLNY